MPALGAADPRWSPAGAVRRCFIPFMNLFHPLWGTLDAWRGADQSQRWIDVTARKRLRPPLVITGWWSAWLIGNWVAGFGSGLVGASNTAAGDLLNAVGLTIVIAAAVLAVLVVREVTSRQERKQELIATGQLS